MPVVIPVLASNFCVSGVAFGSVLAVMGSRCIRSQISGDIARQTMPQALCIMKLIASGVTFSAATMRSPSFSRYSSSTKTIMRPARKSKMASSIVQNSSRDSFSAMVCPRGCSSNYTPKAHGRKSVGPNRRLPFFLRATPRIGLVLDYPKEPSMAGTADALVVETTRLTKIYQNRQIAINDVSLTIEPGNVLGLLGPNGAGKTTLLRLILGLHRPTAGTVRVFGRRMHTNAAGLRCRIGYIPTNPQFPRGMTPISYLDYMARLFGLPRDVRKPRLASLIRAVDLLNASGDSIDRFSNGMTARLAVAASLINEPDLLIWDEPTHGLDIEARRSMLELIKTLAAEKTLIISSHNLGDIDEVCNHAAVLSRGQMIFSGSLSDLKGRIRKNHYELDLEGDQKSIAKAVQICKSMQEFKTVTLKQRRLELLMNQTESNCNALANVFVTLSDNKVTLVSIRSVGQQTEQAYLDLVETEEQRGFTRLYSMGEAA